MRVGEASTDALYGTDAISEGLPAPTGGYDATRGARVITYVRAFLDEHFKLAQGSHADARSYVIKDGRLVVEVAGATAATNARGWRRTGGIPR